MAIKKWYGAGVGWVGFGKDCGNRAKVVAPPQPTLARNHGHSQESASQLNERNQLNERFSSTKTPDPCFLYPMLPKMSENYTDIETRIQAACLKVSELEKQNIAGVIHNRSMR